MYRSLLIQLGETFAEAVDRLVREHQARETVGVLGDVRLEQLCAPVEGVGNLSRPIAALRERLERDISEALEDLLALSPTSTEELLLDVFVLGNLGEPLVANAITVVVDMIVSIVDQRFRTIFPPHRRGSARRLRVVPLLVLPGARECENDRDAAIAELHTLHETVLERRDVEAGPDFPIDRVFLLDAVTTRGIGQVSDLVDQVRLFLRLLMFTGIRRDASFAAVLESECNDLFASIGIACCEVDFVALRETLAARMALQAARALTTAAPCVLPPAAQLLDARILDDAHAREKAIAELDALPARTLAVDGLTALQPLAALFAELVERLDGWSAVASEHPTAMEPTPSRDRAASPALPSIGAGLALGGFVFALAHFGLILSVGSSAATGGAFAVIAAATVFLLMRGRDTAGAASNDETAPGDDLDGRVVAIEEIQGAVQSRKGQLEGLRASFDGIEQSFSLDDVTVEITASATTHCDVLTSPQLLDLLFQRRVPADAALAMANGWLAAVGSWEALLRQDARPTAADLQTYCDEHFADLGGSRLFEDADCRERASPVIHAFLERWKSGVPIALEGESLKQHDADGFRTPLTAALVAPDPLAVELSTTVRNLDSPAVVQYTKSRLDDVFMVSVLLDVHPDAVAALAHLRRE